VSGVVCFVCPFSGPFSGDENPKNSRRSSIIGIRSYPPQYPRSSKSPKPPPVFPPPPPVFLFSFSLFILSSLTLPLFVSSFFFSPYFFVLFFLCVTVCVYLRMCVRAYLDLPCVSASDNVNHIKLNIRYVCDKINELN